MNPIEPVAIEPHKIGDETFVLPYFHQPPGAPVGIYVNTMITRGEQPVLFDTGARLFRDAWLEAAWSVVDPADVRWIVLSHDDIDHVGNLEPVLEACPQATIVSTWFLTERMSADLQLDPRRQRWVGDGETLDIGDRELTFVRPPIYDSPATRAVFDARSEILWGSDAFGAPLLEPALNAADVDTEFLAENFITVHRWLSPWYELLERARYEEQVARLSRLGVGTIASTHGPVFDGAAVVQAFELLRQVPDGPAAPMPGQADLDAIIAMLPDVVAA
jgi:flavorubredoxin